MSERHRHYVLGAAMLALPLVHQAAGDNIVAHGWLAAATLLLGVLLGLDSNDPYS